LKLLIKLLLLHIVGCLYYCENYSVITLLRKEIRSTDCDFRYEVQFAV